MNRKNIIGSFVISFAVFLLMGCSETDGGALAPEKIRIEDKVGISQIEYPETVKVYETTSWNKSKEEIADVFLKGERNEPVAIKREDGSEHWSMDTSDENDLERLVCTSTKSQTKINLCSIWYAVCRKDNGLVRITDYSKEQPDVSDEFKIKTFLPQERDGDGLEEAKKVVEFVIDELNLPEYEIRSKKKITCKTEDTNYWMLFLQQKIDGIPLSIVDIPKDAQYSHTNVYNKGFNHEIKQYDSSMQVHIIDGKLFFCVMNEGPVQIKKEIGNYEVISPKQAYKKALEYYKIKESEKNPKLEVAELQYKSIEKDGQQLLIPVWTIGIFAEQENKKLGKYEICYYYLIDAVSGELF